MRTALIVTLLISTSVYGEEKLAKPISAALTWHPPQCVINMYPYPSSLIHPNINQDCVIRYRAYYLNEFGYAEEARQLMNRNPVVAKAAKIVSMCHRAVEFTGDKPIIYDKCTNFNDLPGLGR